MTVLVNTTSRHAFWTISRRGTSVETRWGRIGTRGNKAVIEFEDEVSAKDYVEHKKNEKLDGDYVRVAL